MKRLHLTLATWALWLTGALAATSPLPPSVPTTPSQEWRTELVASGLDHPWAVAFIGNGRMLVTERPGRLRLVEPDGRIGAPLAGLPRVDAVGQGGLLDLVTDSEFARNRRLFFCFSEPGEGGTNSTALASARLSDDATRLEDVKVIFSQRPKTASRAHFGCRIAEAPDGHLFLTLGDRFHRMADAQKLDNHHGKVVRLRKEGGAAPGNPFAGKPGALPEIWSYGHRNPQGATIGPDGHLWISEHGPQGGDEINRPEAGRNYGWPVISHGVNYDGTPVGEGLREAPGMEQPLHYWVPSIGASGLAFYTHERFPAWRGDLFAGGLALRKLVRLVLEGEQVVGSEDLLVDLGERIRDVRQGPDGYLYVLTDAPDGKLLRVGLAAN